MRRRVSFALVTAALVASGGHDARAADDDEGFESADTREPDRPSPPTPPRDPTLPYLFEIGARSGYVSAPIRGGVNPFGLGFGGRFGFNVSGFYFGASAMDYTGGSDVGATDQSWLLGGEFGYNLRIGLHLTLRPQLGVGDTVLVHTEPSTPGTTKGHVDVVTNASGTVVSGGGGGLVGGSSGATTSVNNVYLQPGLTLLLATTNYFCGVSVSSLLVPGILYGPPPAQQTTWISYSAEGEIGFRL